MALVDTDRVAPAVRLLESLVHQASTHQQAEQVAELFGLFPEGWLRQEVSLQQLYAAVLCRSRRSGTLLAYIDALSLPISPVLGVYRAWALLREGRHQEALDQLEALDLARSSSVLEEHTPLERGLYWRTRGEVLFRLGRAEWHEAFVKARGDLKGAALGRSLVDEGGLLYLSGQRSAARVVWAEALAYLRDDPYYLAWARHSLGTALIKDRPEEAEQHLLEAVRLSRKAVAREFRARALCGLGAVRRSFGEWERALESYHEAAQVACDRDDRQQALWGYGHTLRLLGRTEEALAQLTLALECDPSPASSWLNADIAAARLMLGDVAGAQNALAGPLVLGERGRVVRAVVQAALHHRSGAWEAAQGLLEGLEPANLWVREELHCFPELKPCLGQPAPEVPQKLCVEVNPFGSLEVKVNGRPVPISPTGRPGELLVLLLENGGSAGVEHLLDQLYGQDRPQDRKALWETAERLRRALGWKGSMQVHGGVYRLDPAAEWVYRDRPPTPNAAEFMVGHYANWIQERRGMSPWVV
ncbi:Tetratricopeptide repeat protein [Calidithermus terrae]|uniref:Tetratricopeptide repeat protein n=1 Tax=Calidithermus terrae TaxID=1408545 RepID=A0A399F1V6_9DEIN|nr:Tetratricopeptide repeat protein [Calidithermus terrae]